MRLSRPAVAAVAGCAIALGASAVAAPSANAAPSSANAAPSSANAASSAAGTRSLAAVLTADKKGFDHNSKDYDVVTAAVLAVLAAKPNSPVKVLADGNTAVTAFIPNDGAFRALVADLTKKNIRSEKAIFNTVAGLGIDTVETVLLYHVVPGATVTYSQAKKSDGAKLTTAQGGTVTVDVRRYHCSPTRVYLLDADKNDYNPRVVKADINKGNKQIAHGINRVLRPIDLP